MLAVLVYFQCNCRSVKPRCTVCVQDVMIAEQKQLLEHSKLEYHKKLQVNGRCCRVTLWHAFVYNSRSCQENAAVAFYTVRMIKRILNAVVKLIPAH